MKTKAKTNYVCCTIYTHLAGFNRLTIDYCNPGTEGRGYYAVYPNIAPIYLGRERKAAIEECDRWLNIPGTLVRVVDRRAAFIADAYDLEFPSDYCLVALDAGNFSLAEFPQDRIA